MKATIYLIAVLFNASAFAGPCTDVCTKPNSIHLRMAPAQLPALQNIVNSLKACADQVALTAPLAVDGFWGKRTKLVPISETFMPVRLSDMSSEVVITFRQSRAGYTCKSLMIKELYTELRDSTVLDIQSPLLD